MGRGGCLVEVALRTLKLTVKWWTISVEPEAECGELGDDKKQDEGYAHCWPGLEQRACAGYAVGQLARCGKAGAYGHR